MLTPISQEMYDHFITRTMMHQGLVRKYCALLKGIDPIGLPELIFRGHVHDASKFMEPERTPYMLISWKYKMRDEGKEFFTSPEDEEAMHAATLRHITYNQHHPDFWSPVKNDDMIRKENRDGTPKTAIDATAMPYLYLGEMVADWLAMSEERNTNVHEWCDSVIGKRWKFTPAQITTIKKLIDDVGK